MQITLQPDWLIAFSNTLLFLYYFVQVFYWMFVLIFWDLMKVTHILLLHMIESLIFTQDVLSCFRRYLCCIICSYVTRYAAQFCPVSNPVNILCLVLFCSNSCSVLSSNIPFMKVFSFSGVQYIFSLFFLFLIDP